MTRAVSGAGLDAVVVGAGPAGLATSRELQRRGVRHVVLERGEAAGQSWADYYESLTLHTGRHLSALPGLPMPRGVPLFPPRGEFAAYLRDYAARFALPVRPRSPATAVRREHGHWHVETPAGTLVARALVVATGIAANPRRPTLPGEASFGGDVRHSVAYRRPDAYVGRRVLVVGVGNSGGEIAAELAAAGAAVTIAVRSGAHVVPRTLFGLPVQYWSVLLQPLPRRARDAVAAAVGRVGELRRGPSPLPRPAYGPLDAIPLIGFHLVDAIRAGRVALAGAVTALLPGGARFADGDERPFDAVILATGFAAALQPLGGLVTTDARGFARRTDRVTSADQPALWFVGHRYDASGALFNIGRDAPLAAAGVAATIGR